MIDKHNQFDPQQQTSQSQSSQPVNSSENKELSPALPEGWHSYPKNGSNSLYSEVEQRSLLLVHWLGYGLLVFALLDYIHIVIPPRFTDPSWEFQTIGALVEHAAIPLLGLIFIFYRHDGYMGKREKKLLKFLTWISLIVGLLYLLMVPLGIIDSGRIYYANDAQIAAQVSQRSQQFQLIKEKLNQATTDEQFKKLVASLTPKGRSFEVKNPQAFKTQVLAQVSQAKQNMQLQADWARSNQLQGLVKNSVKWNLGALVSGTLFIGIWHLTRWVRQA